MAGPALDRVQAKLTGWKAISGGKWLARCPAHDDQHQSLQVSERGHDLSVGLHCHAGCVTADVLSAMGLTFADLYSNTTHDGKEIAATYDYRDSTGQLLYQAVRYWPKAFKHRRPDGTGDWIWDMAPFKGKHVPYRLPDLKGHNDVCIVEGEKDADRLWSIGIPATTNIGGAKNWTAHDTKCLKQAGCTRAFVIPDNDAAGHARIEMVAKSVKAAAIAVSVIDLTEMDPDLGTGGDVSDWLSNGGSKEALLARMAGTLYVMPDGHTPEPVHVPAPEPDALVDPLKYSMSHAGAADAFCDRFGYLLRFDHTREQWFVWDQHRWRQDHDEGIYRLALDHVRRWAHEIIATATFTDRKKWQDFTLRLEQLPQLQAVIRSARSRAQVKVSGQIWDTDPWLIGVPNGVIDLRTGKLRDGAPGDWISQQVGITYDAAAECPRWLQFLSEVFDGNTELVEYVWKAVGYSLTGDMREQCFFLAHGGGSNGKSIFLNTMESLLGDYGKRASMRLFIGETTEFQMAELQGARMVFASESKPDTRLNTEIVKSLTGGETQDAQRKHEHPFVFRPVGKIWLGVNHMPKVKDDSKGFWRRVKPVPFTQTFEGATDDQQLRDKLKAELPGILAWAVQGTTAWLAKGLKTPAVVLAATEEYQTAEDPLVEFIAERCTLDPAGVETFSAIAAAYNRWSDDQKIARVDRVTRRSMGIHLKRRFAEKNVNGTRRYGGVKLNKIDDGTLPYGQPEPPDPLDGDTF